MKLQKPPRLHSPFSFCLQQASLKSVTGESSAYKGRPTISLSDTGERAKRQTHPHTTSDCSCLLQLVPPFPIHNGHIHCQLGGPRRCRIPAIINNHKLAMVVNDIYILTCNSKRCPNFASSQYKSSYTASNPSCSSFSVNLQTGSCAGLW